MKETKRYITKEAVSEVISDYWTQLRAYPWQSFLAIFAPGIGSVFVFYVPPLVVAQLVDNFVKTGKISLSGSFGYLALFGLGWLLGEALWRLGLHFLIEIEGKGTNVLLRKAFDKLLSRDYDFYTDHFVGTLSKKAFAYSKGLESVFDTLSFNVSSQVIPIIFAIYILWGYSPWIPLVLAFSILIIVLIAVPIINKRARLVAERHNAGSAVVGRLSDSITNIFAIKSFAMEKREAKTYGKTVDNFVDKFLKAAHFQNQRYDMVVSPVYVLTNVIGLGAAIFFAQTLGLQAGAIIVVFSYYSRATGVFWNINGIYRTIESSVSEAAEFTQLFLTPPKIKDKEKAGLLKVTAGSISFSDVSFKYDDNGDDGEHFLNNFCLDIKSNQKVGLIGPSGGGKTTFTKLLLRFADPSAGAILIDGMDISGVTQESLRTAISYVPQEPLLFHRSLFENIAYSNVDATEKDVQEAAKIAHADEFIANLPDGYNTLVGERGIKLSGGQRQRVAIARALLKKAPILILDEATSSLDSESEKYIQEGLQELMKDKTAIVIAHRLSTIRHLDRILVLDDGKIVQDGTHDELIRQDGLYKKLWSHQSGQLNLTD